MKELKDYLPFYLGCECYNPKIEKDTDLWETTLYGISGDEAHLISNEDGIIEHPIKDIVLILRKLSDMTEEEKEKRIGSNWTGMQNGSWEFTPESFKYMLSLGIDLFGLIEAGLAIDKTTLK